MPHELFAPCVCLLAAEESALAQLATSFLHPLL
jgi:hypothetical protein